MCIGVSCSLCRESAEPSVWFHHPWSNSSPATFSSLSHLLPIETLETRISAGDFAQLVAADSDWAAYCLNLKAKQAIPISEDFSFHSPFFFKQFLLLTNTFSVCKWKWYTTTYMVPTPIGAHMMHNEDLNFELLMSQITVRAQFYAVAIIRWMQILSFRSVQRDLPHEHSR